MLWMACTPVQAASLSFLSIDGMLGPGNVGSYPLDAEFAWITHRYPDNTSAHIWTLAPGSDGGLAIDLAQPGRGQITAVRDMYNQSSWLFSVDSGVHFDVSTRIFDVANLRLKWAGTIYNFGFLSGVSAMVPQVTGAADTATANGWWLDGLGNYHLVFRGDGQCVGCELTVHLTGQMIDAGDIAPGGAPDGQVDVADMLRLMRFVETLEVPARQDALVADMNGDGVLDVRDVLALGQMLGY